MVLDLLKRKPDTATRTVNALLGGPDGGFGDGVHAQMTCKLQPGDYTGSIKDLFCKPTLLHAEGGLNVSHMHAG